ncbi:hypothetical protein TrVE_jg5349 [Triparma verrucosa]|uniref:phosphoglucomutase (alpha-D-glucose-1,6-bisphosphate-dependent) n=1 Tax=Triparma verrucosa TaxID=1606542 RepID=A0A9W7EZ13_9STRA|nr:hypothetical protein TrVE_jg5349 [Triparma verrucosa]
MIRNVILLFPLLLLFTPSLSLSLPTSKSSVFVPSTPIPGMKPGTSGLRKKTKQWMSKNYLSNFIQSLLDTANKSSPPHEILVAGDGRYYNTLAIQEIIKLCVGNKIPHILIPRTGIMSTPAVSSLIRSLPNCCGGIVLTASHNPGGIEEDFGIKYNEGRGQPADESFTDEVYERTKVIQGFWREEGEDIDLNAEAGTKTVLGSTTVTIIDPFETYISTLRTSFDFPLLSSFISDPRVSILFDGMHGAGGPFASKILGDILGVEGLMRCESKEDFGGIHPDPNLSYASDLVERMGLLPDGTANPDFTSEFTLGAANDGDGDRNMICGKGIFVTPSDSLAIIADRCECIPQFKGGLKGVARSMPSSGAVDVVAERKGVECFVTPTGWKFFGNLMDSKEAFGKKSYSPFLCGEESFGTGSDHIREKDGLWAVLSWISILADANKGNEEGSLVQVKDIVEEHWKKYGRHFYCRYDYEGCDSGAADTLMDGLRELVGGGGKAAADVGGGGEIVFESVEEFEYTDPVDGSFSGKQGMVLNFKMKSTGDKARAVFRLSGTGSSGATVRLYLEQYDGKNFQGSAPEKLKLLGEEAIRISKLQELTGREQPTVIT